MSGPKAGRQTIALKSTMDSVNEVEAIAEKLGARVVQVKEKGYGNALRGGADPEINVGVQRSDPTDFA